VTVIEVSARFRRADCQSRQAAEQAADDTYHGVGLLEYVTVDQHQAHVQKSLRESRPHCDISSIEGEGQVVECQYLQGRRAKSCRAK
jgi:hypothetical protein